MRNFYWGFAAGLVSFACAAHSTDYGAWRKVNQDGLDSNRRGDSRRNRPR